MTTLLRKIFIPEPKPLGAALRYGMLAVILLLGAISIFLSLHMGPPYGPVRYSLVIGCSAMLLSHVSSSFPWPRPVGVPLRIVATVWAYSWAAYFVYAIFSK